MWEGICLYETTFDLLPTSLFHQSRDVIESYFSQEQIKINESKIIFIGDGEAGKTYTIQRILPEIKPGDDGKYHPSKTHGILIKDYHSDQDSSIHFWDFGGQQIFHSMHQCFLTDRTGYVVVVKTRKDNQTYQVRKWLDMVKTFAPNAPILLYINLEGESKTYSIDIHALRSEYHNIVDIAVCSAYSASDEVFNNEVVTKINSLANLLDSNKMEFPKDWYAIREELFNMHKSNTFYFEYDKYFEICERHNVTDKSIALWLLEWFNDLGDCFSYSGDIEEAAANTNLLHRYRILEPRWLTKAIYTILVKGESQDGDGKVNHKTIYEYLEEPITDEYEDLKVDKYEEHEVEFVLQLMRKFKMSYKLKRKKEFIPALIGPNSPIEMPDVSEYSYHLCYEFEYLSLPDSLLHQLMVKCIANYTLDPIWKEGFVLNDASRNTLVIVKRGLKENTLILDAYSDNKKELPISLQWVANQIRETGKTLDPKEYIMPNPDAKPDDRDRFNVAEIIKKLNRGKKEIDGITKDYPIIELLGEYYTKEAVQQAQMFVMERHEQLDPSILHTTVSNTINVYGNYIHGEEIIYTDKQLIQSIENDPIKCLLELKKHQDELPDGFIDDLLDIFSNSKDEEVKKIADDAKKADDKKKSLFDNIADKSKKGSDIVGFGEKIAKNAPAIYDAAKKYGPKVGPKVMAILQMLSKFI